MKVTVGWDCENFSLLYLLDGILTDVSPSSSPELGKSSLERVRVLSNWS